MKAFKKLESLGFFDWLSETHNLKDTDIKPEYLDELPLNHIHRTVANSMAFRWFREKNIYATINTYHSVNEDKPFGLSIDYLHESGLWDYFDYRGESDFETYEEAELASLTKLIEILESKLK